MLNSSLSDSEQAQFLRILNGYIYFEALAAGCDLDLFSLLEANPGATVDEISAALSLSQYSARVLLLACCAAELITRDADTGGYYNSGIASKVLTSGSASCMVPFVRFSHEIQAPCCHHLADSLREERNAGLDKVFPGAGRTLYERLAERPALEQMFHDAMGAYTRQSKQAVSAAEFAGVEHLLDVGGGDGSNSIRLCQTHRSLRVTLLDKPSVCDIARKEVQKHGLTDRVQFRSMDIFHDPWPTGCDGILMSHLVEIFSVEKVRWLYRRAYEALPQGGQLFLWTLTADDLETGSIQAAKSSIYFLTTASGEGMAYPAKDHERWLTEAGFTTIVRKDVREIDHCAFVAMRG